MSSEDERKSQREKKGIFGIAGIEPRLPLAGIANIMLNEITTKEHQHPKVMTARINSNDREIKTRVRLPDYPVSCPSLSDKMKECCPLTLCKARECRNVERNKRKEKNVQPKDPLP